ncbi:MAG: ribosome silencing factor [Thiotrichaceae bacterium]
MNTKQVTELALSALDDMKAQDVRILDVSNKSTITETMIVATGTSTRHVKSIAENVALEAKRQDNPALGVEGEQGSEWVLVDLDDVVVHVMLQQTRDFYNLEKLWGTETKVEIEAESKAK